MHYPSIACAALLVSSVCAAARAEEAPAPWSGHVDVVSKYVIRGLTSTYGNSQPGGNAYADAPESDHPALQWGLDWNAPSGWSAGYWGSTINYSYKQLGSLYEDPTTGDFQRNKSIENDFYGAYSGRVGAVGYSVGLTAYTYLHSRHANAVESKLGVSYGAFSLNAQTMLTDVIWSNRGDTYYSLVYTAILPQNITFTGTVGASTYHQVGKYIGEPCGVDAYRAIACAAGRAPVANSFGHLTLAVTMPVADSPFVVGAQAIFGGKNRFGVDQKNQLLGQVSYVF